MMAARPTLFAFSTLFLGATIEDLAWIALAICSVLILIMSF